MKTNFTSTGSVSPAAYIAKSKQRLKQYEDTVYLKNGDEFQIELYNPTQTKVLARIELNSISIGPGIILRPGERIFLDRYVTEARKFLFETYKVSGNNKEVQKAIEKNGDVVIKFFKEEVYVAPAPIQTYGNIHINSNPGIYFGGNYTNGTGILTTTLSTTNTTNIVGSACCYSSSVDYEPQEKYRGIVDMSQHLDMEEDFQDQKLSRSIVGQPKNTLFKKTRSMGITEMSPKEIETGRVEKGSNSDQLFKADYSKFESTYSWISEWKILPESRREVTIEDLVQYCAKCGRKRKTNEIFCPKCGNKF